MQTNRPPQRKGIKFFDIKILIATLAMAVTIGMWNIFSTNALKVDQTMPPAVQAPSQQTDTTNSSASDQDPNALPTLVPLLEVSAVQPAATGGQTQAQAPAPASAGQSALPLRSVAAPTVTIVQKNAPLVDAGVIGGGGGGGGGGSRSVSTTRSSRKK